MADSGAEADSGVVPVVEPVMFNVLWHIGVLQVIHRCATGIWGKVIY